MKQCNASLVVSCKSVRPRCIAICMYDRELCHDEFAVKLTCSPALLFLTVTCKLIIDVKADRSYC